MFKHLHHFSEFDRLEAEKERIAHQLAGQVPNPAQAEQLRRLREASAVIVARVKKAYEKTLKSINGMAQDVSNILDAHTGIISMFIAIGMGLVNEVVRKPNHKLNYPLRHMARMGIA